jgi:hypothetical protein
MPTAQSQGTAATGTVIAWGAQVEPGNYPSSYIPTSGTALNRSTEQVMMNSSAIFSASGGTFAGAAHLPVVQRENQTPVIFEITEGGTTSYSAYVKSGSNLGLYQFVANSGVTALDQTNGSALSNSTPFYFAQAFAAAGCGFSLNGGAATSSGAITLPNLTILMLGGFNANTSKLGGHIQTIDYYQSRLPNSVLKYLSQ